MASRCWPRSAPSTRRRFGWPRLAGVTGNRCGRSSTRSPLGTIDHWVTRPVQAPAEEFHRSITEFLREWDSQRGGGFEAAQVIGEQWSARSQELRDLFSRHRVPAGFYDAASGHARQMLHELGLESPELPVVVLRFAASGRRWSTPPTGRSLTPSAS